MHVLTNKGGHRALPAVVATPTDAPNTDSTAPARTKDPEM